MPECEYCGASHDSEKAHLKHLKSEHRDELGPIDKRRIGDVESESEFPTGPVALGVVVLASVAIVGYVVFIAGSGGANAGEPHALGSVHQHGTIEMTVDGKQIDFSQPQYQRPGHNQAFHFEGGVGEIWHVHAQGVTLHYAMNTIDINVTDDTVTFNGTTYRDSDPEWEVVVQVNGEDVDPETYVLKGVRSEQAALNGEGDNVRIVVRRAN